MENVFLHLVNMSITAGWIALAVMILRLFLKKAPKWITVLLWGLVGLRLILPVSIESVLSLIPSAETIPPEIVYSDTPQIHSGIEMFNSAVNPVISESLAPSDGLTSINPVQVLLAIATIVWITGVAGMLTYTLISYLRLRHKVRVSMSIEKNIYICDDINTPFILGIIKPKIYLPSNLAASEQDYVLRHEKAHIKRKDHLIKPLSFLLLSVYWFNPLLWVAYILLCRDIELACDEKVIRDMGMEHRKEYSTALLNCSIPRRMISACPLAFGEVSVKQRIKTVLNYKKPAFWISIVAIILCIALSVCFLTNPIDSDPYGVKVVDSGSDIEGVSVELMKLDLEEDAENNASIEIKWKNKNAETYTCGEEFYIYKYIDGEWVNIRTGDYAFVTIGYMIPAKGTFKHTYGLWNIEIDEVGTYRFASTFLRDKGDTYPTEYTAWVDFEVTKIPDFDENGFSVTNIHSDREGISAKITDLNLSAKKPYIEVMWINDHDYDVTCGEYFYIYKLTKGEWIDCRTKEESFEDIAYVIPAHGTFTHKYSLIDIDMSSMGTYRFEAIFSGNGEKVRIDFEYPVKTKTLATTSSGSQPYGITGEILSLTQKENHDGNSISQKSTLSVRWSNSNGDPVYTQKEIFTIYKKVNGEWVDHSASQPYYYSTTKVTIPAVKGYVTIDHPLTGVSYLTSGTYKLETHFYTDYGEDITAFIEFTVGAVSSSANYENFETEDVAHFYCNEAQEVLKPQITLYRRTREFQFTLSGLSSYVPTGKYSTDGNILTLTADDGNKYVFEVTDAEALIFLADKSADLPKYRYKQNEDARYPFEDGACFKRKTEEGNTSTLLQTAPANQTAQKVPYSYDEIIKKVIEAFPWERDDISAPIPDLSDSSYMYRRHSDLSEIGYALIDLDNNGQQELIISSIDSTFVYDLYTISGGDTIHLFSSGERYYHILYENGYIELGWNSSTACTGHDFFKLADGKLEFLQRITLDAFYAEEAGIIDDLTDAGNDNTFFRSNSENEKDYVHISDAEALAHIDSYQNSAERLAIEYTPLSEYNN